MVHRFIALFCFSVTLNVCSFTEHIYERLVLGSALLAEVKQVCNGKGNSELLYKKLAQEPLPIYVRVIDKLFGKSKEARLATLWLSTGPALKEVLDGHIFFSLGTAIWWDPDMQEELRVRYGEHAGSFDGLMSDLVQLNQKVGDKIKARGSWWPSHHAFKDSDKDLDMILTSSLHTLGNLRILINNLHPDLKSSPFRLFVPRVLHAIQVLGTNSKQLALINIPPMQLRYQVWREQLLSGAIKRCTPSLRPMAAQS